MQTITIDWETYYDQDYSLSKMQTDEYILDDRYETIMVSVIVDDGEPITYFNKSEDKVKEWLHANFDWGNSAVRCHNTLFDGFLMTNRFDIKPKMWKDTLAQARMLHPYLPSHGLAAMAKYYGLADKGTAVHNAKGMRKKHFSRETFQDYIAYCEHDTRLCQIIGDIMDDLTPKLEAVLIDMTIRMFTEPVLVGNPEVMYQLYEDEVTRKQELLDEAAVDKSVIMSNEKFADRLREYGVLPPMKESARTGKMTYAFAKTDKAFKELADHPDGRVSALVAARLGTKTTIAETRALRFYEMAKRGPLPVYLNFWGAKTTGRYSGGNKVNWQNLPARGPSAGLRKELKAPEGRIVLVGDSSNIELRTVMALAGQHDVVDKLRQGVDMYCDFASRLFGREITKADKAERFLGKTAMLGLQYGAGAARFQEMVRIAAAYTPGVEPITMDRAQEVVSLYRDVHYKVVELWQHCQNVVLPAIANDDAMVPVDVNGWFITQWNGFGRPGEPGVVYKDLKYSDGEWTYVMGRNKNVRIYGPKVVENLCQHAAMKIVMWQTARIHQREPVKLSVHDEAVCVPLIENLETSKAWMEDCLRLTPKWCRGAIPVDCEVEVGPSYGDAK